MNICFTGQTATIEEARNNDYPVFEVPSPASASAFSYLLLFKCLRPCNVYMFFVIHKQTVQFSRLI